MRSRLTKLAAALVALTALAVGGSQLASAGSKASPPAPPVVTQDQGVGSADTDQLQQGDQSAPDNAAEQAGSESESAASESESGPSDGPGGFADSNAGADTQQQGEH